MVKLEIVNVNGLDVAVDLTFQDHWFVHNFNYLEIIKVYVEWTDGKIYEAYYRGKMPKPRFKVKLFSTSNISIEDTVEVFSSYVPHFINNFKAGADCIYIYGIDQLPDGVEEYLTKVMSPQPIS